MTLVIALAAALGAGQVPEQANAYHSDGQDAGASIGQTNPNGTTNYNSAIFNNPMDVGLNNPNGVAIDGLRHIFYVADTDNNRVLVYNLNTDNSFPDYKADFVVGQANFCK